MINRQKLTKIRNLKINLSKMSLSDRSKLYDLNDFSKYLKAI